MRMIDADALIEQIETNICKPCKKRRGDYNGVRCRACQYSDEIDDIEDAPTIEERKKGRWVECDHEKWIVGVHALRCSECHGGYHLSNETVIYSWDYCPNCGARMEETE